MKNVNITNIKTALANRLIAKGEELINKGKQKLDTIRPIDKREAEVVALAEELRKFEATKTAELARWKLTSYTCSVGEEAKVEAVASTKFGQVNVILVKGKVTLNHKFLNRTIECGLEKIALEILVERLEELVLERGLKPNKKVRRKPKAKPQPQPQEKAQMVEDDEFYFEP